MVSLDSQRAGQLLREFSLQQLFLEEVGWDRPAGGLTSIVVDANEYLLTPIAEKRGVQVFECTPRNGAFPAYFMRQRIEREVLKMSREHLVVFTDAERTRQTWQWVRRDVGLAPRFREYHHYRGQTGDALLQRLDQVTFTIEDEDFITITDVTAPLQRAFDRETVTRRFYDEFKAEHRRFSQEIQGVDDTADKAWYASLMLNRLMFLYFIQKRGFMNGEQDYLGNRLRISLPTPGFYRSFLRPLFLEALGNGNPADGSFGRVPYLNGGMFALHLLELRYPKLDIPNSAFQHLFEFLDRYQWHLDDRPLSDGSQINPDVLGFIFEKYVNQKEMGAYYTKEDVTDYMSRNCIAASFLRRLEYRDAGKAVVASVRQLLARSPQNYSAVSECAVDGSPAFEAARGSLAIAKSGDSDLTKLFGRSFDVWECILDAIRESESVQAVLEAYEELSSLRIVDPTCGSGAFLLACMDILRSGYEACLDRMQAFIFTADGDEDFVPEAVASVLKQAGIHRSREYFIVKSVAVNNLFGVDIMEEAVEIARLRLFLCLVSTAESFDDLEPLPDIDFNLRSGNTLLGYTTQAEIDRALTAKLDLFDVVGEVRRELQMVDALSSEFTALQTIDANRSAELKPRLQKALRSLETRLNEQLSADAGIHSADERVSWVDENKPFHWFVAFHSTMVRGGFDVVVGNPPYVGYSTRNAPRLMPTLSTGACGNLYAPIFERSLHLLTNNGHLGLIVPLSITFSTDMSSLRHCIAKECRWVQMSSYDNIPDRLFTGVKESTNTSSANQQRVTIVLAEKGDQPCVLDTTPTLRWRASERSELFSCLPITRHTGSLTSAPVAKLGADWEAEFLASWVTSGTTLATLLRRSGPYKLVVPKTAGYYVAAYPTELDRNEQHVLTFDTESHRDIAMLLLNSNVFFWFWRTFGDGFHVTRGVISQCPIPRMGLDKWGAKLASRLQDAFDECTVYKCYRGMDVPNVNFNLRLDILADIDQWIAAQVGVKVPVDGFLWPKSNSFFALQVPKSSRDDRLS